MTNDKELIVKAIREYAEILNHSRADSIPSFYAEDGLFMPDGFNPLTKADLESAASGSFLKQNKFTIEFRDEEVVMEEQFAFVRATASTVTENINTGASLRKTSHDFFVLKKATDGWQIFRYMFNNVSERTR